MPITFQAKLIGTYNGVEVNSVEHSEIDVRWEHRGHLGSGCGCALVSDETRAVGRVHGEREEVELRVATMVAARTLQRHLTKATGSPVSIAVVDYVLWFAGRMATSSQHHLTITHFY